MRNLEDIAAVLQNERAHLMRRALAEACHWSRQSGGDINQRSDQYWIDRFSRNTIIPQDVRKFLSVYKIVRAKWVDVGVAGEIVALRQEGWEPGAGVMKLATDLARHIEPNAGGTAGFGIADEAADREGSHRISAASKIAMFRMHDHPVFIWDSLALLAIKLRQWRAERELNDGLPHTRFSQSFLRNGRADYVTYHAVCQREYDRALADGEFNEAVVTFKDYVSNTNGPMKHAVAPEFYGRRLFDKLMFCEGERIGEWWGATRGARA